MLDYLKTADGFAELLACAGVLQRVLENLTGGTVHARAIQRTQIVEPAADSLPCHLTTTEDHGIADLQIIQSQTGCPTAVKQAVTLYLALLNRQRQNQQLITIHGRHQHRLCAAAI